jgi:inhibitor of cysteine peptidase
LDWRLAGIVPPVRNQGSCGSCWAFGTVGIMESAIAKIHGPQVDLSEQFLVSCNTYGWNCQDGGLTAHMWHYDAFAKNQTSIGAVLEADKPYTATDGACAEPYAHPFSLSGWEFIVDYEWEMPTVDQIKSAIAAYGPVTAGVCAGRAFSNYTGGVFSTDESCGGWTNHQIILVGWKDTGPTQGYWILRNSWGPRWGESGYMRIAYNTSRVGEGTSWVRWGNRYYFPWMSR